MIGKSNGDVARAIVIDDEPDLLVLAQRILERGGFEVAGTATTGEEGVELVTSSQPDVVLLDLRLPGIDGEEALPTILRKAPRTMVAILSAHLDSERAERLLQLGAFSAYDKGDLGRLPEMLATDLELFRRVLDGEEAVPAWRRRYRRL